MSDFSDKILEWRNSFSEIDTDRNYKPEEVISTAFKLLNSFYDIPYFALFVNNEILNINEKYITEKHEYLMKNIRRFQEGGILDWAKDSAEISILPDWENTSTDSAYIVFQKSPNKDTELIFIGALPQSPTDITDEFKNQISFFIESLFYYFSRHILSLENEKLRNQLAFVNKRVIKQSQFSTFGEISEYGISVLNASISTIESHFRFIETGIGNIEARQEIIKKEFDSLKKEIDRLVFIYNDSHSYQESEVDLNILLDSFFISMRDYLNNHDIDLILDIEQEIPKIHAHHSTIYYILFNILKNSVSATPDGGEFKVNIYKDEKFIHMTFSDSGIGINEELIDKVFVPFMVTQSRPDRMGLSLYIIKNMLSKMKSKISIASTEGEGTTVKIQIPFIK